MKAIPYLLSPAQDYLFIAASPLIGFAVLGLMMSGIVNLAPFALILLIVLEGSHIFATWTRSFLDAEHRQKIGWQRLALLPLLCLIPPLFVMAGETGQAVFYALTIVWLHTHVAKQHVGFVALYKRKAGELDEVAFETKFYKTMLYAPVVFYLLQGVIGLKGFAIAGTCAVVPLMWFMLREYERGRLTINPKLVLVVLTVPLQWAAFGFAIGHVNGAKAAGVVLAFSHTIQYHALMYRYHSTEAAESKAKKPWHSFLGYAGIILALNFFLYVVPKTYLESEILLSMLWTPIFAHYIVDGWVWKTGQFPVLRKALGI